MAKRPAIPSDIERQVLVEAGHRCAIPVCRQVPVEIAHITGWAKSRKHEFRNLIPLCPNCHARFDKGEIDRKSMLLYKRQLAVLNRRYGDLEIRVLQFFAAEEAPEGITLLRDLEILLSHLIADDLLRVGEMSPDSDALPRRAHQLTQAGREFVRSFFASNVTEFFCSRGYRN
jgi:HNH endonuclease